MFICILDISSKKIKNRIMKLISLFTIILLLNTQAKTNTPYEENLTDLNLICSNDSQSVQDWGLTFTDNENVKLFSLDKFIYEIYEYQRSYKTDLRNIIIFKDDKVDYVINRSRLMLGNKKCKIIDRNPFIVLQNRINDLKSNMRQNNKI